MADADIQKLIQQGVEAARAGNKARARELFQQATDADMNNERAWLWLASVTDDPQQKRIHIENVLHINPDNDRAQQMLMQLESERASSSKKKKKGELAPGVSRSRVFLFGGVAVVVWLALMVTFILIGANRRNNFQVMVTSTAQAVANLQATQTEQIIGETATADVVTSTAVAAATGTALAIPSATPTDPFPATWTPTPLPSDFVPTATPLPGGILPTMTPLAAELPRDELAGNLLVGWGGLDRLSRGYLPITAYQLDTGNQRQLGDVLVNNVDINPANGEELIYTAYYPETFGIGIELSNLTVTSRRLISNTWEPLDSIIEMQQVNFSPDGSKLVFVAPVTRDFNVVYQVFLLDLNFTPQPNVSPLRPMTNDLANYSSPALSPDNTRIVAVKEDPQAFDTGPDLVVIEVDGGLQTPLKVDGSQTIEENPAWILPEGNEIAYAGQVGDETSNFDIIRLNPNNSDAPAQFLARDPEHNANYPVFSSDGRFMAFADDRGGAYNIFILEIATGVEYQITNDNDDDQFPGGWYQPEVVEPRGQTALPTPVVTSGDG